MSLFEVEGWSVPKDIAVQDGAKKKKKDNKKQNHENALGKKAKKIRPDEMQDLYDVHVEGKAKSKKDTSTDMNQVNNNETTTEINTKGNENPPKKAKKNKKRKLEEAEEVNESVSIKKVHQKLAEPSLGISSKTKLTPMQQKMMEKLAGSRFRWINEQLYTTTSEQALKIMKEQPEMFDEYHTGFRSQVQSWPQNPVDTFAQQVKERLEKPIGAPGGLPGDKDGKIVVADMGCGEANLALQIKEIEKKFRLPKGKGAKYFKKPSFEVHSFDLKKANARITVADIKNVPLPDESAHIVVFCLALMGTNFLDFIKEGLRLLKPNGEIWIAEIKSRFVDNDTADFVKVLKSFGLFHKNTDDTNKMFIRMEFFKPNKQYIENRDEKERNRKRFIEQPEEIPKVLLKPCIYKRR